jgi:hypothetical protein
MNFVLLTYLFSLLISEKFCIVWDYKMYLSSHTQQCHLRPFRLCSLSHLAALTVHMFKNVIKMTSRISSVHMGLTFLYDMPRPAAPYKLCKTPRFYSSSTATVLVNPHNDLHEESPSLLRRH